MEVLEGTLIIKKLPQLKYLDLSQCSIHKEVLKKLIASCHDLEKLSLMKLTNIDHNLINIISCQNGTTLQVLNLNTCRGLTLTSIKQIVNR